MFDYTKYKYNFKEQETTYLELIKDYDTDDKKIKLLSELSTNIFDYLKYITKLIYDIIDFNLDYLNVLEKIVDKLKFDLAQGDFIDTLISIGKDKNINLYIYIKENSKNDVLLEYSGLILGGYYKNHNEEITDDLFTVGNNISETTKKIKTIMVIYEDEKK